MSTRKPDRLITVCSACLRASCWHGEFYCEQYKTAGLLEVTESTLDKLNREHPSYYSEEKIKEVCG